MNLHHLGFSCSALFHSTTFYQFGRRWSCQLRRKPVCLPFLLAVIVEEETSQPSVLVRLVAEVVD